MRLFTPLLLLILGTACISPAKLLEQEKYAEALELSSRQLLHGRIKAKELANLELSFYFLTQLDSQQVADLRASGRPEVWPEIYQLALTIDARQEKLQELQMELAKANYHPRLDLYPATALIHEAAEKSALYHYANAQKHIPAARNKQRQEARIAYEELGQCLSYVVGFKDADLLQEEMKALGTTHLLLRPLKRSDHYYFERNLIDVLFWDLNFPFRDDWLVIHQYPDSLPIIHFEMELYFHDLSVSSDRESTSSCSNSVKVEDGFITQKVWSEADSAYIEVKVQQYKTVSATVTKIEQSKEASAGLQWEIYDAANGNIVEGDRIYGSSSWSNTYITYSGDDRALTSSCPSPGGMCASYPFDSNILEDAVADIKWVLWEKIKLVEGY